METGTNFNKKPSERMKKTIDIFMESGGKSLGGSMREAGFSAAYAKNCDKLTKTKSWQEMTRTVLSDDRLLAVHDKLLKHKDWRANDAGLEKAYKVRSKYESDKIEITVIQAMNKEQLDLREVAIDRKLKKEN